MGDTPWPAALIGTAECKILGIQKDGLPTLAAPAPYLSLGQTERLPRLLDILTRLEP
jgi:hypothetical protein